MDIALRDEAAEGILCLFGTWAVMVQSRALFSSRTFERYFLTGSWLQIRQTPMQIHEVESAFKLSPLYAILEDGLERLFEIAKSDVFTFYVNGKVLESTVAEAVFLSPIIYESLHSDRNIRSFRITDDTIDANSFDDFLILSRKRKFIPFNRDTNLTFLSLCGQLGNEHLVLLFLASLGRVSTSISASTSNSGLNLSLNASSISSGCARHIEFIDADIDHCASILDTDLLV
jgi:hypothetical protein